MPRIKALRQSLQTLVISVNECALLETSHLLKGMLLYNYYVNIAEIPTRLSKCVHIFFIWIFINWDALKHIRGVILIGVLTTPSTNYQIARGTGCEDKCWWYWSISVLPWSTDTREMLMLIGDTAHRRVGYLRSFYRVYGIKSYIIKSKLKGHLQRI